MALYVNDASRLPGAEEEAIAARLARFSGVIVAALNKTDIASCYLEENRAFISSRLPRAEIFSVSARTGEGVAALKEKLFALAPEGEALYPADYYTDQEPEFRASEIIREKAIAEIRAEVPHALYVEVADMETGEEDAPRRGAGKGEALRTDTKTRAVLWIRAFIIVETESQKGILVGSGGNKIKTIRVAAQKELGKIFPYRIRLDLRVKTRPRWRRQDGLLKKLLR
jgi:GTP-binding protein Era